MHLIFQISAINYEKQKILLEKAMQHLEGMSKINDGFILGKPMQRFGWTFFNLEIKPNFLYGMEKELKDILDMIRGKSPEDKISNFLSDFLETRDCDVKLKLVNY